MPTGNFNDGEKITYSLKYALNLTTQFPTKAPALEKPSPPRIFPTSIPKTPLIEKGVGDIDVDGNQKGTTNTIDMTLPWETIKNYRIIDPKHHRVSRKKVSDVLESSNNNHGTLYASSISTAVWNNNAVYNYWFHDYNTSPYDGTNAYPATDWKGIRLAYNTTAVDTIVKEATGSASAVKIEEMVPHISLYLGVPLSVIDSPWLSTKYVTTPINSETNDSVSWQHDPTKGRFLLNLLGLSDGFAVRILDKDMTQIPAVTTSVSEGGSWLTNASFGMVTFYGITHPHKRSDGGSNIDVVGFDDIDGNGPRMSFCRYIGEFVDFNSGGGSSVTVGEVNAVVPGLKQTGDLYYAKASDTAGTLKINNGSAWVNVGGGVVEGDGGVSDGHLNIKGLDTSGTIITLETNSDLTVANPDVQDDGCFIGTFNTESFPQRTFSNTMSPLGLHAVDWQHDDIHTFNDVGGVLRKTAAPMGSPLVLIDSTNPIYESTTREVGFQYGVGSFGGESDVYCGLKTNNPTNNKITYSCRSHRDQNNLMPYYNGNWTGHYIYLGPNLWNSNQIYAIEMIVTENKKVVIRVHYPSTNQVGGYVPDSDDWVDYTFGQELQSSDYPLRVAAKITVGSIENCKMYPYTPLSVHNPHTINLSSPSFNFYTNRDANNTFGGISNLTNTDESTSFVFGGGNLKVSPYTALKEINNRIKQGQTGTGAGAIDVKPILSITDTQLEVNGNMSIGTTYPLSHAKLHVNGTLFLGDGSGLIDGSLGGCIDFESRDSGAYGSSNYSSALIGTRTHNYTAGIEGGDNKMEMVFFMGNNPTGTYGPDRFSFIGGEFRIHTPSTQLLNTPSTGNKGWDALDEMGGRFENLTPAFIVNNQGNVGIGYTSPGKKLVVKAGSGDGIILRNSNSIRTGSLTNSSEHGVLDLNNSSGSPKVRIHSGGDTYFNGGKVGIGTTTPYNKLTIDGGIYTHNRDSAFDSSTYSNCTVITAGNQLIRERTTNFTTQPILVLKRPGYEAVGGGGNAVLPAAVQFKVGQTHSYYNYANTKLDIDLNGGGTVMTMLHSGKVGIGTTSPGAKLEIQDTVPCIRLTDDRYEAGNSSTELEMGKIEWYSRDGSWQHITPNLSHPFNIAKISVINKPYSGALPDCRIGFFTGVNGNVNEKMSIFSNGNVGIGVPGAGNKLDVAGDINFTGTLTRGGAPYPAAGGDGAWEENGADVFYNTGNVGIGTDSPEDLLTVGKAGTNQTGTTSMSILAPGEKGDAILYLGTGYGLGSAKKTAIIAEGNFDNRGWSTAKLHFCLNNYSGDDDDFWIPNAGQYQTYTNNPAFNAKKSDARMTIQPDGNVGIGTTTPVEKLTVNGNVCILHKNQGAVSGGLIFHNGSYERAFYMAAESWGGGAAGSPNAKLCIGYHATTGGITTDSITETDFTTGQIMTLQGDGNVGIGTNSPLSHAKLHVNGTLFLGAGTGLLDGTLGGCIDFESRDSGAYGSSNYSSALIGTRTHNFSTVGAGNDDKMEMVFFIGNNPTSSYGPDRFSFIGGEFRIHTPSSTYTPTSGKKGWDVLDEMGNTYQNSTPAFIVDGGRVGIGTSSPDWKLQINEPNTDAQSGSYESSCVIYGDDAEEILTVTHPNQSQGIQIGWGTIKKFGSSAFKFGVLAGDAMTITSAGNVGIGVTTTSYPLKVATYTNWGGGWKDYYDYTRTSWTNTQSSFNLGVDISHYCWAKGYTTSSDERIKKNIRDLSDSESLNRLRDISCVHYEYKDGIKHGGKPTIGFIAQQVASIYPGAVSLVPEYIPNEYRNLTDISWNEVTTTDNSGITQTKYYLTSESMGDVSGCKYRFECRDLSANLNEEEIELKGDEYNRFEFEYKYPEIFLYGKEVDDFHILDKPRLFAINFSATQEIDRIQQAEKTKLETAEAEIVTLKNKVTSLETTAADLISRITALESL